MSTIKTANIQNGSSSSVNIALNTDGSATFAQMPVGPSSFLRNKIINGGMVIDQRNCGGAITPNAQYTLDRWAIANSQTGKISTQRVAAAPAGFSNSILLTSLSAYTSTGGDYFSLWQGIEGYNTVEFAWGTPSAKTATLSFWIRSSLTGTFGGVIQNADLTRTYGYTYTVNVANTWEYKTVTIPGDTTGVWQTNNAAGIIIRFSLGVGTTFATAPGSWVAGNFSSPTGLVQFVSNNAATINITGVQFEVGAVATPFEYRHITTEIALAQRYYAKSYDFNTIPGTATAIGSVGAGGVGGANGEYLQLRFPVTMRTIPTVTQYSVLNGAAGTITNTNASANVAASPLSVGEGGYVNPGVALTSGNCFSWQYTAQAEY